MTLVDRAAERAAIDALIGAVQAGSSGSLVLSGPAGIGKSALLAYAVDSASGLRVCRAAGVEAEMAFTFAAVQQVVAPIRNGIATLPVPQRKALEAALGLGGDGGGDLFLVGLATMSLLTQAAEAHPLLVLVDDVQWLDEESVKVLAFAARRLGADAVGMLFAVRYAEDRSAAFEGLPHLSVEGLPADAAKSLLRSVVGDPIDDGVADRLVAATGGNPLALIEVSGELTPDQWRGAEALPELVPLGPRLSDLFLARVAALDEEAQTVLLLAAADGGGDPGLLRRTGAVVGVQSWDDTVGRLEATGLVTFGARVEFRHPLARSAVYYSADPVARRRVHAALAAGLEADGDADRRAGHLAAAAVGPDESVARVLEASAERARSRGGAVAAAAHLRRAAELTADPARATARRLEAARAELTAGNPAAARRAVDAAVRAGVGGHDADAAWTEALVRLVTGEVREAGRWLARALAGLAGHGSELAVGVGVAAAAVAIEAGHLIDAAHRAEVAEGLRWVAGRPDCDPSIGRLIEGVAMRLTGAWTMAAAALGDALRDAISSDAPFERAAGRHIHVVYFVAIRAAADRLDDVAGDHLTRAWLELARRTGALAALPLALNDRSWLDLLSGRFGAAASHLAEIDDMVSLVGSRGLLATPPPARVLRHVWQGDEDGTRAGARRMMQDAHERGAGAAIDQGYAALIVLGLGLGRYEAALRAAKRIAARDSMGLGTDVLADLVEAAARAGEPSLAEEALGQLAGRSAVAPTAWAQGLEARARALVTEGDEAGDLFATAVERLSSATLGTARARTQLLQGEWLRRVRRRREAREPLRDAFEFFEGIGAQAFATRARAELAATGEHVRTRAAPIDVLTPQEAQIARLAAAGERNRDIAAQLYITTSTVEYHLRKVFVKLGVTTRTQLAGLHLPG